MKTVLIYDQLMENPLRFAVVEGDWSKFDRLYINGSNNDEDLEQELLEKLYGPEGQDELQMTEDFPLAEVIAGAKVVVIGFLP